MNALHSIAPDHRRGWWRQGVEAHELHENPQGRWWGCVQTAVRRDRPHFNTFTHNYRPARQGVPKCTGCTNNTNRDRPLNGYI